MVDDRKERQQAHLRAFNVYFPSWNIEDGCIKQIKEDLEKIKKMTDLKEKLREVHFYWVRHHDNEACAESEWNNGNLGELGYNYSDTIEKYSKLVKELWDLNIELIKQNQQQSTNDNRKRKREQNYPKQETKSKKTKQHNNHQTSNQSTSIQEEPKETILCSRCDKIIPSQTTYYHNSKKPDNHKFCSQSCYTEFYGELCSKCNNKFLTLYHWDKEKYPNLTYCLDCFEKEKLAEIQKNKTYCFKCSAELTDLNNKTQPKSICDYCFEKDLEKANGESSKVMATSNENRTEQNRTEQNRTEQNRTEQNRTEQNRTEQNRTEQNRTASLDLIVNPY